jgi:hypothetical protein
MCHLPYLVLWKGPNYIIALSFCRNNTTISYFFCPKPKKFSIFIFSGVFLKSRFDPTLCYSTKNNTCIFFRIQKIRLFQYMYIYIYTVYIILVYKYNILYNSTGIITDQFRYRYIQVPVCIYYIPVYILQTEKFIDDSK